MRILYFDIDGVLLNYDDKPKPALSDGVFQIALQAARFTRLICVSGWADIVSEPILRIPESQRALALHHIIAPILPDRNWFLQRVEIATDTDHRCRHIDLETDWFYVDDWADKFFSDQFGREAYEKFLGERILLCDPYGDGNDILDWLRNVVAHRKLLK